MGGTDSLTYKADVRVGGGPENPYILSQPVVLCLPQRSTVPALRMTLPSSVLGMFCPVGAKI